ncbi:Conserved_hypothetical protein [Hexamita inflata]|uniref:Myb-like DNA-binding domain-containing protein n=1 Tax=Hexamita inflata TaxID=28002 RepID=A0ABP1HDV6_9EUKA
MRQNSQYGIKLNWKLNQFSVSVEKQYYIINTAQRYVSNAYNLYLYHVNIFYTSHMRTRIYDKWTQSDRDLLLQLVQQHNNKGKINWKAISDAMQTRTTRQCYDQYIQLFKQDESGQRHQWTSAEQLLLISSFNQSPYDWKTIQQQHFQRITVKQLKNKYNQLTRNQKSKYFIVFYCLG